MGEAAVAWCLEASDHLAYRAYAVLASCHGPYFALAFVLASAYCPATVAGGAFDKLPSSAGHPCLVVFGPAVVQVFAAPAVASVVASAGTCSGASDPSAEAFGPFVVA